MHRVSIIICCHNSAALLSATLSYLRRQEVSPEIVVVDDALTDGTSAVARANWSENTPTTLRVVTEKRLGLTYARTRGLSEAKYEIVSFIDDDNWVWPNWIELVSEIMAQHPDMAACGGRTEAVCEVAPPFWFESCKKHYAIGAQADEAGDISHKRCSLWGAGLSIRKSAWEQLLDRGFQPLLVDRQGTTLSTGGDGELSRALHLAGWGLWYDPRLQIRHFLPADRFEWHYLRKLCRGNGAASVFTDVYRYALRGDPTTLKETLKRTWQWKIFAAFIKLLWYSGKSFLSYSAQEGNPDILRLESVIGRLSELLRTRKSYRLTFSKGRLNQLSQGYFST
jgi:glycosyltransferase involved in cell wall biosynthesis